MLQQLSVLATYPPHSDERVGPVGRVAYSAPPVSFILKESVISPLLKKSTLDKHDLSITQSLKCSVISKIIIEIERTDRCCSETESVTAQICSGGTEPNHTRRCASRRGPPMLQTAVAVVEVSRLLARR